MPAKDRYHNNCKQALIKDGWTITHDPFNLRVGRKDLFIDLGAEKFLGAQKGERKIVVEIKSFIGLSEVNDFENAVGQYIVYQSSLKRLEVDRTLYLALRQKTFQDLFSEELVQNVLADKLLKLLVFEDKQESIVRWIN